MCVSVGVGVRAFLVIRPFEFASLAGKCSEARRDAHTAPAL